MAANIWNSIAGYVIIDIEGAYLERLINSITKSGIEIWDISRRRGSIRLSVSIGGFYRLRPILRQYPCRIRIVEKHGLTVALCHMGSRYVMAFGWVIALSALLIASRFMWIIDIEGCGRIEQSEIDKTLDKMGVSPGTGRGKLDTAAIAEGVKNSDGRSAADICKRGKRGRAGVYSGRALQHIRGGKRNNNLHNRPFRKG